MTRRLVHVGAFALALMAALNILYGIAHFDLWPLWTGVVALVLIDRWVPA